VDAGVLASLLAVPGEAAQYAWFLGAGASLSSGAPLAATITCDVKRRLFRSIHGHDAAGEAEIEQWLRALGRLQDPDRAYGEALEWLLPRPRQRRNLLYEYLIDARPSPGYVGLVELARRSLLRIALTTNFDDLLKQAAGAVGQRLREVAHGAAAGDFEWPPRDPTLLKLHGDFLFDSIRNTESELEALEEKQTDRLQRSAADGGLVVIGYRGADESIMSVLEELDDVPLGLYWLHLPTERPHGRVEHLLSREWAYHVVIEGFDEFVALVIQHAIAAGRAPLIVHGALPRPAGNGRFVTGSKVRELLHRVEEGLQSTAERICTITGLPGVGKTALARHAADRSAARFAHTVILTAQRRTLDLATLLDTALRDLRLPPIADLSRARDRVLEALSQKPILLLLDNLEQITTEVAELLRDLPEPSRALVTVRDPGGLRHARVAFREVHHDGLSTEELREILKLHAAASPRIDERVRTLGDTEIDQLLHGLHGWPQALMLVIGQLDDPVAAIVSAERLTRGGDLVQLLLRDGYAALPNDAHRVLSAHAAFAATITPEGAAYTARMSLGRAEEGLRMLLERRWLVELGPRTYAYAHPLVQEFVRSLRVAARDAATKRAAEHLTSWIGRYGGQPDPDWSNFRQLDREAENVRGALEDALDRGALKRMTDIMQPAFSYFVERGHWAATDRLAQRVLAVEGAAAAVRAEWLVWRSWLALYLREDPAESARLAEEALATGTNRRHPRFEAHRRALTAYARTGEFERARSHAHSAAGLRPGSRDSNESIDLRNAVAALDLAEGTATGQEHLVGRGLEGYREAYRLCAARDLPNTRELGVALIGEARALQALGKLEEALDVAERAETDAASIGWLRGREQASLLIAELAQALGRIDLAHSAEVFAKTMGAQLRSGA
jgi:tetratricopeptide (TPR) repeat protein